MHRSPILVTIFLLTVLPHVQAYPVFKPLKDIPKAEDVVAFSNSPPHCNLGKKSLKKEDIMKFLRDGKGTVDPSKWDAFPIEKGFPYSDGVIATKDGKVFFWFLRSSKSLQLENEDGESCLFYIP